MKLLSGIVCLAAAEQSYAHAHLIQFPHHAVAAGVLVPASVVFLALGVLLCVWALLTEFRQTPAGQ